VDDGELDLGSLLAAVEEAAPVDVVDALGRHLARTVGARHVGFLITNFSGSALVRLSHVSGAGPDIDGKNERAETVPLPGTIYERVVFSQVREVVRDGDGWLVLVPVTERGDALGVLEVACAHEPDSDMVAHLVAATHALAYVLIAARRHTDLFEWAQRDIPFSVSAEIQRRLLPAAYTAETGPLTVAGWLEPSHDAGGDTFDYCLDRDYLYASLTDAMGHSTQAAMLATLTVAALRNRRRAIASPSEQAEAANHALHTHAARDQFVTGLLVRTRLADGSTEIVDAGHPAPFLVRDGAVVALEVTTHPPFGVATGPYQADTVQLEPGDRLLLITDGYLDRLAERLDIEEFLMRTLDRHPRQIVQDLARELLRVTGGQLRDDATALCLDWYGPAGRRQSTGGASRARATLAPRGLDQWGTAVPE
jgi:serine phosphatase RsbU (regulator of sigma subunit)